MPVCTTVAESGSGRLQTPHAMGMTTMSYLQWLIHGSELQFMYPCDDHGCECDICFPAAFRALEHIRQLRSAGEKSDQF